VDLLLHPHGLNLLVAAVEVEVAVAVVVAAAAGILRFGCPDSGGDSVREVGRG
jgi:hypothetical protein